MPIIVDPNKCNGCYTSKQPPCVRMCPGDLIVKDMRTNKAYLKYKDDCWDCLPCVKACPEDAIVFQMSYQMGFHNASLQPHVPKSRDRIIWNLKNPDGSEEVYEIQTRIMDIDLDEEIEGLPPQGEEFNI